MPRWRDVSRFDRAIGVAGLLCLLLAPTAFPLARALAPTLATCAAFHRNQYPVWETVYKLEQQLSPPRLTSGATLTYAPSRPPYDPWDRPWKALSIGVTVVPYSIGPDGTDDEGGGDDVTLRCLNGLHGIGDFVVHEALAGLVGSATVFFPCVALILAWTAWGRRLFAAPRSRSIVAEVLRGAFLTSVPALVALWLVWPDLHVASPLRAQFLMVSLPVAILVTLSGLIFGFVMAMRLKRPFADEA